MKLLRHSPLDGDKPKEIASGERGLGYAPKGLSLCVGERGSAAYFVDMSRDESWKLVTDMLFYLGTSETWDRLQEWSGVHHTPQAWEVELGKLVAAVAEWREKYGNKEGK